MLTRRRTTRLVTQGLVLATVVLGVLAQEAERVDQSEREAMFRRYLDFVSYIDGSAIQPHWMADGSSFWYAEEAVDGRVIFKVDPANNTRVPFFDTDRLRGALAQTLGHEPEGRGVPFDTFDLIDNETAVTFAVENTQFVLHLGDYSIEVAPSIGEDANELPRSFPDPIWRCCPYQELLSPDGSLFAGIEDHNVYVRSPSDDQKVMLTDDGTEKYFWTFGMWLGGQAQWSPDSSKLAVLKGDIRNSTHIPIVRYDGPSDEVELVPFPYGGGPEPGRELYIIDISSQRQLKLQSGNEFLGWHPDGSEIFVRHRVDEHATSPGTVLAVNPDTGVTRVVLPQVVSEPVSNQDESRLTFLPASGRFIWPCDGDGWRHLCLYGLSGELITQLTGNFSLERLVAVDEEGGGVYFTAHADSERIYDTHFYRVGLEGGNFQQLTEDIGHHVIQLSPSKQFFLDTHSTPDRPPQVDLRTADGRFLRTLATARIDRLVEELAWKPPEEFIVKAADGTTDLHGVLYTPFDFDPERRYPVIQRVYGSGVSIVPRTFIPIPPLGGFMAIRAQAVAQLGYVTVIVDARGTRWRDTAFQNVVWDRPGLHEIADYASALRQLADTRPYMDLSRVGITGGSYGGYPALHGILSAPDVYHVAVVTAGISELPRHINRGRLPAGNREAFEYASNLRLADNLEGKLLLIHGTGDDAVPLGHTMRMVDALIKANKQFDLLIMPGETHETDNIWGGYGLDAELRYFKEHLNP